LIPVPPTLKEGTDNYRLFMALRPGIPKSHHELYGGLHMIVHSRASDLRLKHGCLIDTWRDGATTWYQLRAVQSPEIAVTDREPVGARASGLPSASAGGPAGVPEAAPGPQPPLGPGQLLIWEAA
jgi:hypothetical protein